MAAQRYTTRTEKRWGGSPFTKIIREVRVRVYESHNAENLNLGATFVSQTPRVWIQFF